MIFNPVHKPGDRRHLNSFLHLLSQYVLIVPWAILIHLGLKRLHIFIINRLHYVLNYIKMYMHQYLSCLCSFFLRKNQDTCKFSFSKEDLVLKLKHSQSLTTVSYFSIQDDRMIGTSSTINEILCQRVV